MKLPQNKTYAGTRPFSKSKLIYWNSQNKTYDGRQPFSQSKPPLWNVQNETYGGRRPLNILNEILNTQFLQHDTLTVFFQAGVCCNITFWRLHHLNTIIVEQVLFDKQYCNKQLYIKVPTYRELLRNLWSWYFSDGWKDELYDAGSMYLDGIHPEPQKVFRFWNILSMGGFTTYSPYYNLSVRTLTHCMTQTH